MTDRKMLLAMQMCNGYGSQAAAWRFPGVDPSNYTDFTALERYARAAERGKIQFLFLPDFPALRDDVERAAPMITLDPVVTLSALARATEKIGFVATGSTTFNEPYNFARQFKTLDVLSGGRIGWNAVTTGDPAAGANFGQQIAPSEERYERAHEFIQLTQALWGSWERDAWIKDVDNGIFADPAKIAPINMGGRHVASRGPLPIPPSAQGQPVIFQAGGSPNGLGVAGRYAGGVIGATFTIDDAKAERARVREAVERAGRDPDEVKYFAGVMPAIAPTKREALDRRRILGEHDAARKVRYLGVMLGLSLSPDQLDKPLNERQLLTARANPGDPRSAHALAVAKEGWTLRDVLAHGVIDYHPTPVGPASVTADHMQEWFEAGAVDGFWVSIDVYEDGIDAFVDGVVPTLQERGLFHDDYEGSTLRDHIGARPQYGIDPRITG